MTKHHHYEQPDNTVVIVGGGWSGLAAAIELVRHKIPVILLESAKQLGGRARSVHIEELYVDNGQHMLLGAYESTLNFLRIIGIRENDVFRRQGLSFQWFKNKSRPVSLSTPKLPAPLHLAWGLLTVRGLPLKDRLLALKFSREMQKLNFTLEKDCSVKSLLEENQQSPAVIQAIWEPLCLGALNTQIHEASAQIFLRTLSYSFGHSRRDSDLLLTKKDLGAIFPEPASDYIETHGGSVRLGQRVTHLNMTAHSLNGVSLTNSRIKSHYVILATPSKITKELIDPFPLLKSVSKQLNNIEHRPICTAYLQYPENIKLGRWMRGSLGTKTQWIFDRRLYGQDGLMSVVISSDGEHMDWDNEKLCNVIQKELATIFPRWPQPLSCHIIREKRATFASTVNIDKYRPDTQTPIKGLWLAGDYTNNGLPGTLEGAVRSGLLCAQQIINEQKINNTSA
jgi:squalene-associated FAD-dependent desaturase